MKRLSVATFLMIFAIINCGYAYAVIEHPENTNIVGLVDDDTICFNNDGAIESLLECDTGAYDEGYIYTDGFEWRAGVSSGIYGCGTSAVASVTDATCSLTYSSVATCTDNGHVLIKTTKSGDFFSIKADAFCLGIALPEDIGLVPCLSYEPFDPVRGCARTRNATVILKDGYIKLDTLIGPNPPSTDCSSSEHYGRMLVDSADNRLYVCTHNGWKYTNLQ